MSKEKARRKFVIEDGGGVKFDPPSDAEPGFISKRQAAQKTEEKKKESGPDAVE